MPARPTVVAPATPPAARPAGRRQLPARRPGYTQKVSVGGHRLYLSTGEYADGTLGEIAIGLPKESPAFRGLMESLTAAVSVGLQHGVPLGDYVDAFALTRFGPAGAVEGDEAVPQATSILDYVARHLAANYLPGQKIAPPAEPAVAEPPPLPLDLPEAAPRARRLRLVGG
jgi:ribonucleoside-diphosphate reductase alpha chain